MREVRVLIPMYSQQRSPKGNHAACLGEIHGSMWRYTSLRGYEGTILSQKRNHWTNLWYGKRESWFQIYTDVWKSADENEGRAHLWVHEFEKACKMQARMGIMACLKGRLFYFHAFKSVLMKAEKIKKGNELFDSHFPLSSLWGIHPWGGIPFLHLFVLHQRK